MIDVLISFDQTKENRILF